jgi:hypothetical protein
MCNLQGSLSLNHHALYIIFMSAKTKWAWEIPRKCTRIQDFGCCSSKIGLILNGLLIGCQISHVPSSSHVPVDPDLAITFPKRMCILEIRTPQKKDYSIFAHTRRKNAINIID